MILKAIPGHLDELVRLHRIVLPNTSSSYFGFGFVKKLYTSLLSDKNAEVWVYLTDNRVVGFISLTTKVKSTYSSARKKFGVEDYGKIIFSLLQKPSKIIGLARRISFENSVFRKHGNYPTILTIGISPDYQGKGIGSELLKLSENYFRRKGFNKYFVDTEVKNKNAVRFYTRNNFKPVYYFLDSVLLQQNIR